jgi:hypothetical protein
MRGHQLPLLDPEPVGKLELVAFDVLDDSFADIRSPV